MRGVGGVIGTIHNNSTNNVNIKIENCNNFGTVHNDYQAVGGIAGLILSNAHKTALTGELTIKNCTNSGEVVASDIVAEDVGTEENKRVGYVVGYKTASATIEGCNNTFTK